VAGPGLPGAWGRRDPRQRRTIRRSREPDQTRGPGVPAAHLREQGPGHGRLGDPPAPRARQRQRDRAAWLRRRRAPRRGRHLLLHRQLSGRGVGRGVRGGGLPGPGRTGHGRVDDASSSQQGGRRCPQRLRRQRRAALHPRPADDLPRRRGGPAAGLRRACARPAAVAHHDRPGRAGERRRRHRLQQHVLRLPRQPADAGPGAGHGGRLGDLPAPRRGQRLGHGTAGVRRIGRGRRAGHLAFRGQRPGLGGAGLRRRGSAGPHRAAARHAPPVRRPRRPGGRTGTPGRLSGRGHGPAAGVRDTHARGAVGAGRTVPAPAARGATRRPGRTRTLPA
jgi:hypothetical protein